MLEALLFVADEPIAASALGRALELTPAQVRRGLDELAEALREEGRGVRLQQGPDGAQLVTAPDLARTVEHFLGLGANRRLSNAALETLAIVAYRQPVTRHAIDQIRGVNSDGAVATLRARGLIEGIGRAPRPRSPAALQHHPALPGALRSGATGRAAATSRGSRAARGGPRRAARPGDGRRRGGRGARGCGPTGEPAHLRRRSTRRRPRRSVGRRGLRGRGLRGRRVRGRADRARRDRGRSRARDQRRPR